MRNRMLRPFMLGPLLSGLACLAAVVTPAAPSLAQTIRIGGTGAALAAMQSFAKDLAATDPGITIEVLPSLGTHGGIRALLAREIDIAIAARPPRSEALAKGLNEAACLTTALVFASSHHAPPGITRAELPRLYADPSPVWPDGQPLKVVLPSRAGSEISIPMATVPGLAAALENSYRRPGMPVGATAQENADLATRTAGSLAITTLLQIGAERLDLQPLALDGIAPTAATLADGSYPFQLRICAVLPAIPAPAAARFVAYIASPAGQMLLRALGAMPSS